MVHRGAGKHPCFYNTDSNGTKVEVKLIDGNLWLTQEQIVALYNSSKPNISEHIKHILEEGELDENSVVRKFRTTANDGKQYNVRHYNLDMVLAIGLTSKSNWFQSGLGFVSKAKWQRGS